LDDLEGHRQPVQSSILATAGLLVVAFVLRLCSRLIQAMTTPLANMTITWLWLGGDTRPVLELPESWGLNPLNCFLNPYNTVKLCTNRKGSAV